MTLLLFGKGVSFLLIALLLLGLFRTVWLGWNLVKIREKGEEYPLELLTCKRWWVNFTTALTVLTVPVVDATARLLPMHYGKLFWAHLPFAMVFLLSLGITRSWATGLNTKYHWLFVFVVATSGTVAAITGGFLVYGIGTTH